MVIVAVVLGPELTDRLLVSRAVADQVPEIGSVDPHAVPLGTLPDTVTVIEALAPLASEKPLQLTTCPWCFELALMLTVPLQLTVWPLKVRAVEQPASSVSVPVTVTVQSPALV
jgi:hypothetical protein